MILEKVYDELYGMIEDLKKKVASISGGSVVTITPTLESGEKLADYSIDGSEGAIYAPSNMEYYSSTERLIGEWIDGSPLYRKTYACDALPNNTTKTVSLESDMLPKRIYGIGINSNDPTTTRPLPFAGTGSTSIRIDTDESLLRLITADDWSAYNAYVTIEYTKTQSTEAKKTTKKK